ncbi:unnamed protein product, partial [Prorocentrum cordatum]
MALPRGPSSLRGSRRGAAPARSRARAAGTVRERPAPERAAEAPAGDRERAAAGRRALGGEIQNRRHGTALIEHHGRERSWGRALDILRQIGQLTLEPGTITLSAAISACGRGLQWTRCLQLLGEMRRSSLQPNGFTFTSCISACSRRREWARALAVFAAMQGAGVVPSPICWHAVAAACRRGGQWLLSRELLGSLDASAYDAAIRSGDSLQSWRQSLHFLWMMRAQGLEVAVPTVSVVLETCRRGQQWQRSLALAEVLLAPGAATPGPAAAAYHGGAIAAWGRGQHWAQALALLADMPRRGVPHTADACGAAVRACARSKEAWAAALRLVSDMLSLELAPDEVALAAAVKAARKGRQWQHALAHLGGMRQRRMEEILDALLAKAPSPPRGAEALARCLLAECEQRALLRHEAAVLRLWAAGGPEAGMDPGAAPLAAGVRLLEAGRAQ